VPSSTLAGASLQVHVNAALLEVLDELRDDDRREIHRVMNKEVLETAEFFPKLSTKARRLRLKA
jgi:hypothetical protein